MDDIDQWFLRRVLPEDVRLTLRNDDSITCAEDLAIKADQLLQSKQFQPTSINFVSNRTNKFPSRVKKLCYFHEKDGKDSKRCAGTPIEKCSMWYLVNPSSERKRQAVERVTVLSASISNPQSGTHLVVDGFVVDTGSKITVVPKSFSNKILINKPIPLLSAANGSSIKTFGHCKISPMILGKPYEFLAVGLMLVPQYWAWISFLLLEATFLSILQTSPCILKSKSYLSQIKTLHWRTYKCCKLQILT